ncbi:MAG: bifunctional UDP-N-acetylglucosamine diphosphorylase/glucosamine-1-phosphate N-acetyltransferase GlmU [Candidatus Sericytochromatia bacterium]
MNTPDTSALAVAIMAAGKGTRMKSETTPKVLHTLAGRSMVLHVLHAAAALEPASFQLIVGHGGDKVREHVSQLAPAAIAERLNWVEQTEQLGTGHAVQQVLPHLADFGGHLVVLNGDVPLLSASTLQDLTRRHLEGQHAATLLTTRLSNPSGYGRILKDNAGRLIGIREDKECTPAELAIDEVNSGIYLFAWPKLAELLPQLNNHNAKGEYYLTDILGMLVDRGLPVGVHCMSDHREVLGINSRKELADVEAILQERLRHHWMEAGVTLRAPETITIGCEVELASDVEILPGTHLQGRTRVGSHSRIGPHSQLNDAVVGEHCEISFSVLQEVEVGHHVSVGPYAHLRPGTVVEAEAKIGNFVELKNTHLGRASKAGHLSYLGDAEIGSDCNIGAGTITCNYDGAQKHRTEIGDDVFVGSHSTLVAPVRLAQGAYTGAGSVITEDLPAGSLGLGRARQTTKPGWAESKRPRK